jgi:hypothetical protein
MGKLKYHREITALVVVDPITISFRKAARYGLGFGPSQKRMTAFVICCRS